MSYPPVIDSKPFSIGGLDDLEKAFQFSKTTKTRALLIVCGRRLQFWKFHNFSNLLCQTAKKFEYPFFRLVIDAQDKIAFVWYAMNCKDVSAIIYSNTLPLGKELQNLAKEQSIDILASSPL